MAISRTSQLPCGCITTWSDLEGQYVLDGGHTCSPEAQRTDWLAQEHTRVQSARASERRLQAPLNGNRGFSLLLRR